jgi:hypothetical protein
MIPEHVEVWDRTMLMAVGQTVLEVVWKER